MPPFYDPGLYKCRTIAQGFNEASTGTPQFWIQFDVLERIEPFNDDLKQFSRRAYFAITAKTADWVMNYLHTLGFKGDNFDGVDPHIEGHHSFVRNEIELVCSHEDDQHGTPRERWGPRGGGRLLGRDKIRNLNRLLTKKSQSANGPISQETNSAQATDEDLPF
jgi:hypothetical protein